MPDSIAPQTTEHVDCLIVGAGISGVAAAYHIGEQCPDHSIVVLESEKSFGGTWWTHRSPGIRSDSDLHTFGYRFKPWIGPPIATAEEILAYMGDVIEENDLAQHIRYQHKILTADWSEADSLWTIDAIRTDIDEPVQFTANFLFMCQGYYRHNEGFTPEWPGMADFKGTIAHPENWPDDLDYSGKNVVVIGSGATAATVVPAMTDKAAHVTMLQRTPTYFRTGRNAIEIAEELRELQVDETWIHEIVRRKIQYEQTAFTKLCRTKPDVVRRDLIANIRNLLGPDFDVEKHFAPDYRPWRQRIAFVPDADLFKRIAEGKASVVTDHIERFTEDGIQLKSGETFKADVIVTATGFNMNAMGDIGFSKDGQPFAFNETVTFKGTMFTGIPNLAYVFGYFRGSWTLRSEIIADFVCRILNHMRDTGAASMRPELRPHEQDMELHSWVDEEDFNPGYLLRAKDLLPKRGESRDWRHTQDHWREKDEFPAIDLTDEVFQYRAKSQSSVAAE